MIPLSCLNCCHNPLQSDSLGTPVGFCTEHRRLLLVASELTCGLHFRRDLPLGSARRQRELHQRHFSPATISSVIANGARPNGSHSSKEPRELKLLANNQVGEAVLEYGKLDSKIASLAQFKQMRGAKAELAMLSLSRAYVNRCAERHGPWTSGLHLLWWVRRKLAEAPHVEIDDLRGEAALAPSRRRDLAEWSLLMLRLTFISDVGTYADGSDEVAELANLAETAAESTRDLSPGVLLRWISREGLAMFDRVLPEERYERLAEQLRREPDA